MGQPSESVEIDLPINVATRKGLIAFFREARETDENYEHNYFPDELAEAYVEIYDNQDAIESISISVEFE